MFFAVAVLGAVAIHSGSLALVLPSVLTDLANTERTTYGLTQLSYNSLLEQAAQAKANDMATKGYFSHNSPDGVTPWQWVKEAGYNFAYAGENLAVNFTESINVNRAWMDSPGHRANILNNKFTEVGIATAKGMYKGRETIFVVQMFGRPAASSVVPVVEASSDQSASLVHTEPAVVVESASTSVLSAEGAGEMYIEAENIPAVDESMAGTSPQLSVASALERAATNPSLSLRYIYTVISLITIGAVSMLLINFKKHHVRHAMYGILIIVFLFVLLAVYHLVFLSSVVSVV